MKTRRPYRLFLLILLKMGLFHGLSLAAVSITMTETEEGVTLEYEGSFHLRGLQSLGEFNVAERITGTGVRPDSIAMLFGSGAVDVYSYPGDIRPPTFGGSANRIGSGTEFIVPSASSGDTFGFLKTGETSYEIWVPAGYTPGESISGSGVWLNTDFVGMGIDLSPSFPSGFGWGWGSRWTGTRDLIVLDVIPEPSSLTLVTLAGISLTARRRRLHK